MINLPNCHGNKNEFIILRMVSFSERSHARSLEENDLLERSIKKVRAAENRLPDNPLNDIEMPAAEPRLSSFKEMLLGGVSRNIEEEREVWSSEEEDTDMQEDDQDFDCPAITVDMEEKRRLRQPWEKTLIVKLLGRNIGYTTLMNKIKYLWRPKAMFALIALDNGFFLVKFTSVDDYI